MSFHEAEDTISSTDTELISLENTKNTPEKQHHINKNDEEFNLLQNDSSMHSPKKYVSLENENTSQSSASAPFFSTKTHEQIRRRSYKKSTSFCKWSDLNKYQKAIYFLLFFNLMLIAIIIFLSISFLNINENSSNTSQTTTLTTNETYDNYITELFEKSEKINKNKHPKNLIVMIGDGMGANYNNFYRMYHSLNETLLDTIFERVYSTKPAYANDFGNGTEYYYSITDSAAGATVFSCGVKTIDLALGIDKYWNPRASILAASKRKGMGTGVVVTDSVTGATPAAFTAHSIFRKWEYLIAQQQIERLIDGQPMIDILFGGGKKYFEWMENNALFENNWNRLIFKNESLNDLTSDDLPVLGLFADNVMPFFLDRLNDGYYPSLLNMSMVAINLLNEKYSDEGFFLMIEGSSIDKCGHRNDISCVVNEMDEFYSVVDSVMDFVREDNETLMVVIADHETGGLSIGRSDFYLKSEAEKYFQPDLFETDEHLFLFNAFLSNLTVDDEWVSHSRYKWFPGYIGRSKHTAQYIDDWFSELKDSKNMSVIVDDEIIEDEIFPYIEENWFGSMTESEKAFLNFTVFNGLKLRDSLVILMNVRVGIGWSSHGHTSNDVSLYMFDGNHNLFANIFRTFDLDDNYYFAHLLENNDIGELLVKILDVEQEMEEEDAYLKEEYLGGRLNICPNQSEWMESDGYWEYTALDLEESAKLEQWNNNTNIEYPVGNFKYNITANCM